MSTPSGLGEPPEDLSEIAGFPAVDLGGEIHRLSEHRNLWFFSSVDTVAADRGGRFDLTTPLGTCYTATTLEGCLTEKLLRGGVKTVPAERLDELYHAKGRIVTPVRAADLTAARATGYGCNAEIHTTLDYPKTRRWAGRLHSVGFRALRHLLRSDPAAQLIGYAWFGPSGRCQRPPEGCEPTRIDPLDIPTATRLLTSRGVAVVPIPNAVPIEPTP